MKNRFYKEYQEKDIQAFEYTKKLQKEKDDYLTLISALVLKYKFSNASHTLKTI